MHRLLGIAASLMLLATGVQAAPASPNGVWELDSRDTRIALQLCGDGSQLCGTLVWLSDADYNKQYEHLLDAPVASGLRPSGDNRWRGAMEMLGHKVVGTITQHSESQMTLQACAFLVVCKSYTMFRYAP